MRDLFGPLLYKPNGEIDLVFVFVFGLLFLLIAVIIVYLVVRVFRAVLGQRAVKQFLCEHEVKSATVVEWFDEPRSTTVYNLMVPTGTVPVPIVFSDTQEARYGVVLAYRCDGELYHLMCVVPQQNYLCCSPGEPIQVPESWGIYNVERLR